MMGTFIGIDYRGDDPNGPKGYVRRMLEFGLGQLKGFAGVYLLIRPGRKLTLADRRTRKEVWDQAVETWQKQAKPGFAVDFRYDLWSTLGGPCSDWWLNIWRAFQHDDVDRIIYLPVDVLDLVDPPCGSPDGRLQDFIDRANAGDVDLLLGNYECVTDVADARKRGKPNIFLLPSDEAGTGMRKDIRKNLLETATLNEMWAAFPQTTACYCGLRTDPMHDPHPRTGWFSLSRRLYEDFVRERVSMLPYAGTVQLLLCALVQTRRGEQRFTVAEQFIGRLKQHPEPFDDFGFAHQLARIRFVVENERAYWSRRHPRLPL